MWRSAMKRGERHLDRVRQTLRSFFSSSAVSAATFSSSSCSFQPSLLGGARGSATPKICKRQGSAGHVEAHGELVPQPHGHQFPDPEDQRPWK